MGYENSAADNPFAGEPARADLWEQGFLAGFTQPGVQHERFVDPDALEAYLEGVGTGAKARLALPPDVGGVGDEDTALPPTNAAFEFGLHTLGNRTFDSVFPTAGGIPGVVARLFDVGVRTWLQPDDWEGAIDQPHEAYVVLCPRTDHGLRALDGGYWAAPVREFYYEVIDDAKAHPHAEAFVARCSRADGLCGPVWPGPAHWSP
ncbi:hypothetical protein [Rhodococcus sp. HNM0569]|uniref:hypothetical protein n=1 Tax=Rhodococcus sp. HNM0569 TaxID=2716340 RepID=UPI00146F925C|nr:hypothetical protein [Rhodococcus sp. HNM0569]NLU83242.1 hypothetical protein [Rhodococcus sp. HNM0569]